MRARAEFRGRWTSSLIIVALIGRAVGVEAGRSAARTQPAVVLRSE
jgi:hypothetical protein